MERVSDLHPVRGMRLDVVLNLWMCSASAFRTRDEIIAAEDFDATTTALDDDSTSVTTNVDGTAVVPVARAGVGGGGSAVGRVATVSRSAAAAMETTSVHAAEIAALRSQVRACAVFVFVFCSIFDSSNLLCDGSVYILSCSHTVLLLAE